MRIEIPLSKVKTIAQIIGCSIVAALSLWVWVTVNAESINYKNDTNLRMASIAFALLFGFSSIYLIRKLVKTKIGLVIDNNGFQYKDGLLANEFISWSSVSKIDKKNFIAKLYVSVHVNNINEIIERQAKWKQSILRSFVKSYGTPIRISSENLKISYSKLYQLMHDKFSESKAHNGQGGTLT